jgi:hypothetical protein
VQLVRLRPRQRLAGLVGHRARPCRLSH